MPTLTEISEVSSEPAAPALEQQWSPAPEQPTLEAGGVHIWRALLDDPRLAAPDAFDSLSLQEIIHAERLPSPDERTRYIALRMFLRNVLSRYTGIAPAELRLSAEETQSPVALSMLRFTYSHSDGVALLAITHARALGVEVERVREDLPFEEIAGHFFEPREQWDLRILFSPEQKAWKFFDFWTTNEACLKATSLHSTHSSASLSLYKLVPATGFLATVAIHGADSRLALWAWQ